MDFFNQNFLSKLEFPSEPQKFYLPNFDKIWFRKYKIHNITISVYSYLNLFYSRLFCNLKILTIMLYLLCNNYHFYCISMFAFLSLYFVFELRLNCCIEWGVTVLWWASKYTGKGGGKISFNSLNFISQLLIFELAPCVIISEKT